MSWVKATKSGTPGEAAAMHLSDSVSGLGRECQLTGPGLCGVVILFSFFFQASGDIDRVREIPGR